MFTYRPQDNSRKVYIPLILNTVCCYLGCMFVCFLVMVVHVCPEQLNYPLFFRKILHVPQILWVSSIFCIFEPSPAVSSIFSHWGQLRDSNTTITEDSNFKIQGWKLFQFKDQGKIYSFCLLGNMQVASEGQYYMKNIMTLKQNLHILFSSKVFTPPPALNASCFFL